MERFLLVEYFVNAFNKDVADCKMFSHMNTRELSFYFNQDKVFRLMTMALESEEKITMKEILDAAEEAYAICTEMAVAV